MTNDGHGPDLSIVIAIEGDAERIPTLMAHLERQTYPASRMEIVLITHPKAMKSRAAALHSAEGAPIPTRILTADRPFLTAALNQGIRAAHGRYVFFLDEELLPSPHWVEQHMATLTKLEDGACCVGALRPHPDLESTALTAWFMSGARSLVNKEDTLGYLDWRRNNLVIRRDLLLEVGGFNEQFVTPQFADAELAYRLVGRGARGHYVPSAVSYVSYEANFDDELHRHYLKGAGLFRLFQIVRDPSIYRRYPVHRNIIRRLFDALFMPFYIRACSQADENTHLLGHVYKRIFFYQRALGYANAARKAKALRRERVAGNGKTIAT